ncbi:MAG: hypothetical protein ACRC92_02265 [Peptostreptococcaceae bacterium]
MSKKKLLTITTTARGFSNYLNCALPLTEPTKYPYDAVIAAKVHEGLDITIHNLGDKPLKLDDGVARTILASIEPYQANYNEDISKIVIPTLRGVVKGILQVGKQPVELSVTLNGEPILPPQIKVVSKINKFRVITDESGLIKLEPKSAGKDTIVVTEAKTGLTLNIAVEAIAGDLTPPEPVEITVVSVLYDIPEKTEFIVGEVIPFPVLKEIMSDDTERPFTGKPFFNECVGVKYTKNGLLVEAEGPLKFTISAGEHKVPCDIFTGIVEVIPTEPEVAEKEEVIENKEEDKK